ncbi:hypothetical protein VTK56DRAFT_2181 [Thermocarpiscus australiensis]
MRMLGVLFSRSWCRAKLSGEYAGHHARHLDAAAFGWFSDLLLDMTALKSPGRCNWARARHTTLAPRISPSLVPTQRGLKMILCWNINDVLTTKQFTMLRRTCPNMIRLSEVTWLPYAV